MNFSQIDELLKNSLSPKRYEHSVNVMIEATALASIYGLDERRVRIASLLHDCGREIENSLIAEKAKQMGIKVLPIEIMQPVLLHCKVGKVIAKEKYEITDDEILGAIEMHTTGAPNMTPLQMLIFIADLIEPARRQPGVEVLRRIIKKDLKYAMKEAIRQNIKYLSREELFIHPQSIECWNDLVKDKYEIKRKKSKEA